MDAARLARALGRRAQATVRRARDVRSGVALAREDVELVSTAGYRLAARVTRPADGDALPGLVVSPAIHEGRAGLEGFLGPVAASEIARLGYAVLTFDPAGRGESWGAEDFGGPEHQDDLRVAIRWMREAHARVGVLSLSLGVAAAAGALARWRDELDVSWLVDWEGPCDREIVTAGGTKMAPADGHALDDEAYWRPREAVRHVGALRCGYVRLQADPDHAQPGEVRHATRMLHAAKAGDVPWLQINDHPRGEVPPRPVWLRGGTWSANRAILRKLAALR
ncbi:MAG: alpha/beta hydrolase family protein [Myxococcota bacterium]